MEKKKKTLNVLCYILLAAAFVLCIYRYTEASPVSFSIFSDALIVLATVAGFLYAIKKYKKNAAMFYKAFMFLFCLALAATVVYDILASIKFSDSNSISQILETIICVNFCMLTFAKDLGEKTSKGIAYSILAVSFINSLRLIILFSSRMSTIARALVGIFIAGAAVIFVLEKYMDKAERGTK